MSNQIDLYGADGEVATSIKTLNERNSLEIFEWAGDCMMVWEFYSDETYHAYAERELLFDTNRNLLCEVLVKSEGLIIDRELIGEATEEQLWLLYDMAETIYMMNMVD